MKIPAIYHDPTGSLLPNFETAEGIHFSSGYENLSKCVRAILQKTSGFNSVAVQDQFESMQGDS
jgi:hypothetical protein